jgi:hypothetical protein
MPRRSFCSHSLSSSNRKEVALKERTKERVGEANPPRKKRTRPRFLAVVQTKKTIRAEMRAPPVFFCGRHPIPFFLPIGNVLLLPPLPPLKNECPRQGDDVPPLSPSSFDPPARSFFSLPGPVPRSTKYSSLENDARVGGEDKLKIIRPRRRGPHRWFFFRRGRGGAYHTRTIVESHAKKFFHIYL